MIVCAVGFMLIVAVAWWVIKSPDISDYEDNGWDLTDGDWDD